MKQVLQNLSSGETLVADVPAPLPRAGSLRIATSVTLVSAGTERMLVDFARGSLVSKARQQPEKVRQTLDKMRSDGLVATVQAVRSKLVEPLALGYCNVGRVIDAGADGFAAGDRVVSNGRHAEIVVAPVNLCARIPDDVSDDHAVFTVLGAIALQGIRLAQPTLGESFAVFGLGSIGLMAVQMLIANGCRVLAIDNNTERLELARRFGADICDLAADEDPVSHATAFSRGRGVDGVLLALSSTSDEPVAQAARMSRKRGRIVLVGVTGLKLNRADFYDKELSFQVSCSYGPGRYDPVYEEKGQDYPVGFVRWTEQRNFEAVLDLLASGRLDVAPLISHRVAIDDAAQAYDLLASGKSSLGILLDYPQGDADDQARRLNSEIRFARPNTAPVGAPRVAFIGAGNYGGRVLVDAFGKSGAVLDTIVSANGVSSARHGEKAGFRRASSDAASAISDPDVDVVCIATRHDSHASFTLDALRAGKHVFVEKPLALHREELEDIANAAASAGKILAVGFNRRFAPMVIRMKELLATMAEPKALVMTVNAGAIPVDHWVQDPVVGGGRLVGEACHFIDLLRHLAGAPISAMTVAAVDRTGGPPRSDTATISLRFADGSIGAVHYLANGHKGHPKERLEAYCGGRVLCLDNFRKLTGHGWPGFRTLRSWRQDKGQQACAAAFLAAVRGVAPPPVPLDELIEVSRLSIEAAEQAAG